MTNINDLFWAERWASNNASDVDFRHRGVDLVTQNYIENKVSSMENKEDENYKINSSQQQK